MPGTGAIWGISANWVPEAEDPAIMAARDAGIPVMIYNSGGAEKAKELGATLSSFSRSRLE